MSSSKKNKHPLCAEASLFYLTKIVDIITRIRSPVYLVQYSFINIIDSRL